MAAVQIFLSTVSAEFETYREALQQQLTARGRSVSIQEDFAASGTPTLDKLDGYVKSSDVVVHLLGDLAGAMAQPRSVDYLRQTYPDFAARFPVLTAYLLPGGPALSYTQWEAWLALYHRRPIVVAEPLPGAPRGPRYVSPSDADRAGQQMHRALLAANECHVEIRFDSIERLAIELHKALVPLQAGPAKPCDLPPAAGHFVGRADALADLTTRLRSCRHVTVVGGAGMGKTALAAAALRAVLGDGGERLPTSPWPDGVVLLDLYVQRGMADPAWHALANRVKGADWLPDQAGPVRAAQALRDQRLLIVVEGAEQADGQDGRCALPDLQRPLGSTCRWLVLTRLLSQADPAERVWLQERLTDGEAGDLLDQLVAEGAAPPLPAATLREPVLALLQGHPLALTWAGKLLARGDEDPHWLLHDWQASHLPPLSDPQQGRHTLAWLFDRSVSRLDDGARAVLAVAGCLAPTPVPLAAFAAGLTVSDEAALRAGLRSLVQHGLLLPRDNHRAWQFAHVLAYGYARERCPAPDSVPPALADWLMQALQPQLGRQGASPDPVGVAASLEHAAVLLTLDRQRRLWPSLLEPLLHDVIGRLVELGWSTVVEATLSAVAKGLAAVPSDQAAEPEFERTRSVYHDREADLAVVRGDLAGAERASRSSLAVTERLAQADPGNSSRRHDLCVSHINVGNVLCHRRDFKGAEAAYRTAMALAEWLVQVDRSNADWQRCLTACHDNLGEILIELRDFTSALVALRVALAGSESRTRTDPANTEWQRDLNVQHIKIGHVLRQLDDLAGAEAAFRAAKDVAEQLVQKDPYNTHWQSDLSDCQSHIAVVLDAQGDLAGAEKAYRESLALAERLAQEDPGNVHWQRGLFVTLWAISDLCDKKGDRENALPLARRALGIAQRLAKLDSLNVLWQVDLRDGEKLVQRLGG